MPQFQPRPMVVIRNQLLAFMVLNLLGSCVPVSDVQPAVTAATHCCSQSMATAKVLTTPITLITPQPQSR